MASENLRKRSLAGAVLILLLLTSAGLAQEKNASAHQSPSIEPDETHASGPRDAIKVHGHWAIEIHNPDGSLVTHREFENSLQGGTKKGDLSLALLLGRANSMGLWMVRLFGPAQQSGPCYTPTNNGGSCVLLEPADTYVNQRGPTETSRNLTLTVPQTGPAQGKLVLAGSITASASASIGGVGTCFALCPATGAPSSPCPFDYFMADGQASLGIYFTFAQLNSPISVSNGQIIQVTVTISFT